MKGSCVVLARFEESRFEESRDLRNRAREDFVLNYSFVVLCTGGNFVFILHFAMLSVMLYAMLFLAAQGS